MRVSVIIPSRARPQELLRCLQSLRASTEREYELIVVLQGEPQPPAELLALLDPDRDTLVRQSGAGKCRALNEGIRRSSGELLAFTDDDCTVPAGWIERGIAELGPGHLAAIVTGPAVARPHDERLEYVPAYAPKRRRALQGRAATRHIGGLGGNLFVRRSVFERVGLFDEQMGPGARFNSSEDQDLTNRALRAGFTVVFDPGLSVTHWGGRTYAGGAAARLLRQYSCGIGALAAKDVRLGDFAALYPLAREAGAEARDILRRALRRRQAPLVVRSPWLVRGFATGLVAPLDRRASLFRAAGSPAQSETR
jgi:glycosyltransferase involved in cell wall biosynthesis